MDAVALLNQHADIHKLLEYYSFDTRTDGHMLRSSCKIHGGDNPDGFVANLDTNLYFCHTGACGGGDMFTLVQKMENCGWHKSVARVASVLGISIEGLEIVEQKPKYVDEMKRWMKMVKSQRKAEQSEFRLDVEVKSVKKFRTFKPETIEKFGMVYVPEITCHKADDSEYVLRERLAIPIHDEHGRQVGVSLRRIKATDIPKWSHQPRNVKAGDMLYNYDRVQGARAIVVCEGIFDVWAFDEIGVAAVATYGAHVSDEQYRLLLRTGADLVDGYDGDSAGRDAGKKLAKRFKGKSDVYRIELHEGEDPESIPREELLARYERKDRIV